jgi:hypothetical protein
MAQGGVKIDRAPLLAHWAGVVADRQGCNRPGHIARA